MARNLDISLVSIDFSLIILYLSDYQANKFAMSIKKNLMEIGEVVKKLRVRKELTQKELAQKISVTTDSIHRYENDYADKIPADKLKDIAKALDTSVTKLYQFKENPSMLEEPIHAFGGSEKLNEITLMVKLDGKLETLNAVYNTLKKLNAAI